MLYASLRSGRCERLGRWGLSRTVLTRLRARDSRLQRWFLLWLSNVACLFMNVVNLFRGFCVETPHTLSNLRSDGLFIVLVTGSQKTCPLMIVDKVKHTWRVVLEYPLASSITLARPTCSPNLDLTAPVAVVSGPKARLPASSSMRLNQVKKYFEIPCFSAIGKQC